MNFFQRVSSIDVEFARLQEVRKILPGTAASKARKSRSSFIEMENYPADVR
jgi:hypothetical protein